MNGIDTNVTPAGTPPPRYVRPPKSPILAVILSLFPGLGQVYNGQPAKALVFFFAWAGSIYGVAEVAELPFGLLIPFVHLFNLVDAGRSASLINARAMGGAPPVEEDLAESPAWGVSLVVLGAVLLLHNLGLLRLYWLRQYWPLLLIVAGVVLLRGSLRRRGPAESGDGPRP
jgi:hypothetical protein